MVVQAIVTKATSIGSRCSTLLNPTQDFSCKFQENVSKPPMSQTLLQLSKCFSQPFMAMDGLGIYTEV